MTDRELLELAAKAAGMNRIWSPTNEASDHVNIPPLENFVIWNPLTDDGDAFRLAVKLKLFLDLEHCNAADATTPNTFWFGGGEDWHAGISHDECDPYAATRMAIVRAAAEIGNGME